MVNINKNESKREEFQLNASGNVASLVFRVNVGREKSLSSTFYCDDLVVKMISSHLEIIPDETHIRYSLRENVFGTTRHWIDEWINKQLIYRHIRQ